MVLQYFYVYSFSVQTYLYNCYSYSYLLPLLVIYWFSLFRQSLCIVNQIYGLDLSLNQFESTKWSSNHLSSRTALNPCNCLRFE